MGQRLFDGNRKAHFTVLTTSVYDLNSAYEKVKKNLLKDWKQFLSL